MPRLKRIEFFSLAHQRHSSAGGSGPSGGWRLTQVSEVARRSDPTSQKRDAGHPASSLPGWRESFSHVFHR
jgi:hypothetical protein